MGLFDIFKRPRFDDGAVIVGCDTLVNEMSKVFSFTDDFTLYQRRLFFADRLYAILELGKMREFVNSVHSSLGAWGGYSKDLLDCDDHEAMFRSDRAKGRWKHNLKTVEAIGGIAYRPKAGGYHKAAWAAAHKGGKIMFLIYQPQSGTWNDLDVVGKVVFADA